MKERISKEPRRSPYLEVSLSKNEVHEYLGKLGQSVEKLGEEIRAVSREINRAKLDPSAASDDPAYLEILNKRLDLLADEWERMHAAKDALNEARRLAGDQEMGEA